MHLFYQLEWMKGVPFHILIANLKPRSEYQITGSLEDKILLEMVPIYDLMIGSELDPMRVMFLKKNIYLLELFFLS